MLMLCAKATRAERSNRSDVQLLPSRALETSLIKSRRKVGRIGRGSESRKDRLRPLRRLYPGVRTTGWTTIRISSRQTEIALTASTDDAAEGDVQTRRQGIKLSVVGPQQSIRSEQDGGEQRHIDRPAPGVLKLLPLYQCKSLVGRRNDGLLKRLEIAECALPRGRGRAAGDFDHDQRMAQHQVCGQQRLKYPVGVSEMRNPNRGVRKYQTQRRESSAGRRRGIDFILGALPPKAARRFPA